MEVPPQYQMPPPNSVPPVQQKGGVPAWAKWLIGCGVSVFLCCPIGAALLFPVFSQAKVAAQSKQSLEHVKELGMILSIYSSDFDDRVFPVEGWNGSVSAYVPDHEPDFSYNVLNDPLLSGKGEQRGFGMNAGIGSKSIIEMEDPSRVVAFALTTTPGEDALVTSDTLRPASPQPYRTIWATVDGAAKKALIDEAKHLQWKPKLKK